jgi:hypothetical protein
MNLLSLIFSKHFWKVTIPFSSVSENLLIADSFVLRRRRPKIKGAG